MNVTLEFVHDFASQLSIEIPQPSNVIYAHPIAQLHEIGHFAVTQVDWYQRWARAIATVTPHYKASPWIPTIHAPFVDPFPRDLSVQVWVGMVMARFELTGERFGFHVPWEGRTDFMPEPMIESMALDWGKNPVAHLREWSIDPQQDRFTAKDDGFVLPHPDGIEWDQVLENWQAIALQYEDLIPPGNKVFDLPEPWMQWIQARYPKASLIFA